MRLTSISRSSLDAAASILLLTAFFPFAMNFKGPGVVAKAVLVLMCLGVDGPWVGVELSGGVVLCSMKAFITPAAAGSSCSS
jgi:hypothetical protein